MESDAIDQPEQALTEALLALSWPLPRTVEDADAALTRLEQVKAVLTRLEQESAGSETWWASQVDALATQSGFVLEWWRPVLRDPDLDWSLNHQAHLTADLATLASAGARLLDQIEPHAVHAEAAAAHARPQLSQPQPSHEPSGAAPGVAAIDDVAGAAAADGLPIASIPAPSATQRVAGAAQEAARKAEPESAASASEEVGAAPSWPQVQNPVLDAPAVPSPASPAASASRANAAADDLEIPVFPPPPPPPPGLVSPAAASQGTNPEALSAPPTAAPPSSGQAALPAAREPGTSVARHRRPVYDFDDPQAGSAQSGSTRPAQSGSAVTPVPSGLPPAALTQPGMPPRAAVYAEPPSAPHPVPGLGGPAHAYADAYDDDDDESARLVPTGLRRHQRRLLVQTGAILAAIGALCWWAVYSLGDSHHPTAAGDVAHSTPADAPTATHPLSPTPSSPATQSPKASPSAAPPTTAAPPGPDQTRVTAMHITLLGGSSAVPQIDVLVTLDTAGPGQISVTGSYFGATAHGKLAASHTTWVLSGHTTYQFSVPIANSAYCGSTFNFTLSAGGHSQTQTTSPGC